MVPTIYGSEIIVDDFNTSSSFPINDRMLLTSLQNGLLPVREEDLILLSDFCKISNSNFFELPLDICQVILTTLVLTLRPKLPEDFI